MCKFLGKNLLSHFILSNNRVGLTLISSFSNTLGCIHPAMALSSVNVKPVVLMAVF